MNRIPHDYHIHTRYSVDSKAEIADVCRSAIAQGIAEIGITEHFDLHPDDAACDWFRLEPWKQELERCRHEFGDKLIIRAGIEVGEPHLFQREVREMLQSYAFDYALGSLHWVGHETVFDPPFFRRPPDDAFRLYFEELARVAESGVIDVLTHFDVMAHAAFDFYGPYEPGRYESLIRAVLRLCIENQLALEINTRALRRPAQVLSPRPDILRWYAEMGGDRVTLGSDAHRPEHVGAGLDAALPAAKDAGIRFVAHFEQRRTKLAAIAD